MIELTKVPKPQTLQDNAVQWTELFIHGIEVDGDSNSVWSKCINKEIKEALIIETCGKCAYCESKILHDQYGDIEHYYPKSLDPLRAFEWENLTLACKICNSRKAARDPHAASLIDPYTMNPEDHLIFVGAIVTDTGTTFGRETTVKLGLNRPALCERRMETLGRLASILSNTLNTALTLQARQAIYDDFRENELSKCAPFAGMARAANQQMQGRIEAQWAA